MNTKKLENYLGTIIIIFAIVLIFIGPMYKYYIDNYIPKKFTIAVLDKVISLRSGPGMTFKYYIKNKLYDSSFEIKERKIKIGERYFFSFPAKSFFLSYEIGGIIHLDYKVPNHIHLAPREGWTLEELQKLVPEFQP